MNKLNTPKRAVRTKTPVAAEPPTPKTKQALVISMLKAPQGASIASISQATDWQAHSVRGFFAGVVRKKLGLQLTSEIAEGGRIYRVVEGEAR